MSITVFTLVHTLSTLDWSRWLLLCTVPNVQNHILPYFKILYNTSKKHSQLRTILISSYQHSCHDPACLQSVVIWLGRDSAKELLQPSPLVLCSNAVDGGWFRFSKKWMGVGIERSFMFGRYVKGSRFADSSRIVWWNKVRRGQQRTSSCTRSVNPQ